MIAQTIAASPPVCQPQLFDAAVLLQKLEEDGSKC